MFIAIIVAGAIAASMGGFIGGNYLNNLALCGQARCAPNEYYGRVAPASTGNNYLAAKPAKTPVTSGRSQRPICALCQSLCCVPQAVAVRA